MGEWADYWYGDEDVENPMVMDPADFEQLVLDMEAALRPTERADGPTPRYPTRWCTDVRVSPEYL